MAAHLIRVYITYISKERKPQKAEAPHAKTTKEGRKESKRKEVQHCRTGHSSCLLVVLLVLDLALSPPLPTDIWLCFQPRRLIRRPWLLPRRWLAWLGLAALDLVLRSLFRLYIFPLSEQTILPPPQITLVLWSLPFLPPLPSYLIFRLIHCCLFCHQRHTVAKHPKSRR